MAKVMKKTAVITLLLTIIFCLIYRVTSNSVILSLAITFGTIAYHFIIRLLVGYLIDFKMKNQADYTKKWYQVSDTEMKLYQKLKVKTWKNKMPTFDMDVLMFQNIVGMKLFRQRVNQNWYMKQMLFLVFCPLLQLYGLGHLRFF